MSIGAPESVLNLNGGKLVVLKIGTSSLIREDRGTLNLTTISRMVEVTKELRLKGHSVVIVTSGAVGVGCQKLGLAKKPEALAMKQALAAVGQVHLMRAWTDSFVNVGLVCAQVLLTAETFVNRAQYQNARNTFVELLNLGAVPIINENDAVAVKRLKYGDNDTVSALVATLLSADFLFLLTDVDALYTSNPHSDPNAKRIPEVHDIGALCVDTSMAGTQWGTGGMATKLTAARIATAAGCHMVICQASAPEDILRILEGESIGTLFHPLKHELKGRKRWILAVPVRGRIVLDENAVRNVRDRRKSLFALGVLRVEGAFNANDAVSLCTAEGLELGRALPSYTSEEIAKIKGLPAACYEGVLGYAGPEEVVSRDNIALVIPGHWDGRGSCASLPSGSMDRAPSLSDLDLSAGEVTIEQARPAIQEAN